MYDKVDTSMNFLPREKEVLDFWKQNEIFEKVLKLNEGAPEFTFYDGPPTANGKPHIGHILTRVIKDIIPRYRTMKGYHVARKAGWDTHGLPVELEVEKSLGINGKPQIESYGIEPFIKKCKESVWKYKGEWEKMSDRVGYWADMEHPYVTYDDNYIESEWWALKTIADKGLLYKGYKIVPYCPRCGTALSSHEVAQGYKDVKETSVFVKFRVKGEENKYFLAWTTTPWTLPSNVALCMNPNETYVEIKAEECNYILAKALVGKLFEEGSYEVVSEKAGKDYEYAEYEPLFDFVKDDLKNKGYKAYYVTNADYVTMDDGTGVVHIAPAFGEDDHQVGDRYNLPAVKLVDGQGKLTAECGEFAGIFVKDADKLIIRNLKEKGLLFKTLEFTHSYPFCWRCDTPLLYYPRESWFIKMTAVKDNLVKNNNTVNWIPESIGKGRFGDWLENIQDWGISRNRYWGTPLNIWECSCGHRHSIGSIAELKELSDNCPDDIELHRPFIDDVTIKCEKCGGVMKRVPEVIDCWYDSGAMPFAQHHYPFENQEVFKQQFPAAFISEAVDQTRGWFYSLMAISTLLFDRSPYENVIVLGLVQDENGQKMSKSKGNAVDPFDALSTYGADAIRWYFYTNSAPWLPNRFHGKAVVEGQRKFMGTLWNTYAFYILYANIDKFDPTKYELDYSKLSIMDKWLLSRLNSLIGTVDGYLGSYAIPEAARALQSFVDDMSNWYVRRGRERFWAQGMEQDKINAYMTLYTALVTVIKLSAPMIPFMTEDIYRNLVCSVDKTAPESVHLCDYPVADPTIINKDLETSMDEVLNVVVLGRAARNGANIKNRQPLGRMFVTAPKKLDKEYCEIIEDELNVKELEFVDDSASYVSYSFKPQLKTVGPKYGKLLGGIRAYLQSVDGTAAKQELDSNGAISFTVDGNEVSLAAEDLLIETVQKDGFRAESGGGVTVVLDTNLTPELVEEGFVRELISKIQTMRKDAGFEVMDTIKVYVSGNDGIAAIFDKNGAEISHDVLATEIIKAAGGSYTKEWDINGEKVTLGVEKN